MARAAQVVLGNGSEVYWRDTNASGVGTGSFVKIPSVRSVTLPVGDREEVDTTDLDSENDYKEFQLGDKDPGTSTLSFHFNATNAVHVDIATNAEASSADLFEFKVLLASGYYKTWRARIQNLEYDAIERNTPVSATLNLRNSGAPDAWTT